MARSITSASVLSKIGCEHLALYKGDGYWYFVYSDEAANIYESESVYTMFLNSMNIDRWVNLGSALVALAEAKADCR